MRVGFALRCFVRLVIYAPVMALILRFMESPFHYIDSESDVLDLPLNLSIFPRLRYHNDLKRKDFGNMTQADRMSSIIGTLSKALWVFDSLNVSAFLDCGTLLGYHRIGHILPWDDDGDLSFFAPDCRRKFDGSNFQVAAASLLNGTQWRVRDLSCDAQMTAKGRGLSGRFIDQSTGFYIDIYSYDFDHSETHKIERQLDNGIPVLLLIDKILPLRPIRFHSQPAFLPNDPGALLSVLYDNLKTPLIPWAIQLEGGIRCLSWVFLSLLIFIVARESLESLIFFLAVLGFSLFQLGGSLKTLAATLCVMALIIDFFVVRFSRNFFLLIAACATILSLLYDSVAILSRIDKLAESLSYV